MSNAIERRYELAREQFAELGVDTEKAMQKLAGIPISMHCWQGDDVGGFEQGDGELGAGLEVTGNYPGKARTPDELRQDAQSALSLIPGNHRFNIHAFYAETEGKKIDRNELAVEHFQNWIDWAKEQNLGIDFNPTFFAHPLAQSGFTLANADDNVRKFWIEHGIACRKIGEAIGKQLGKTCITNIWIPDGYKDVPVDRKGPRERLVASLDTMLADKIDPKLNRDAVESKLFGIGCESYVVGSHEFYMGYATTRNAMLCLDAGHFHPTEVISEKLSAVLCFVDEVLLHVSRGVRWDSDHVVILNDELKAIASEIIRGGYEQRVHIGLDFFDASINRIAAWTIGVRSTLKALLMATLEPIDKLREAESQGDHTARLAQLDALHTLPVGAVWDYYCTKHNVPTEDRWLDTVREYERNVLSKRSES